MTRALHRNFRPDRFLGKHNFLRLTIEGRKRRRRRIKWKTANVSFAQFFLRIAHRNDVVLFLLLLLVQVQVVIPLKLLKHGDSFARNFFAFRVRTPSIVAFSGKVCPSVKSNLMVRVWTTRGNKKERSWDLINESTRDSMNLKTRCQLSRRPFWHFPINGGWTTVKESWLQQQGPETPKIWLLCEQDK